MNSFKLKQILNIGNFILGTGLIVHAVPLENTKWLLSQSVTNWPCKTEQSDSAWQQTEWPIRVSKSLHFLDGKPVTLKGVFTNKTSHQQGITITGFKNIRVSCNEKILHPEDKGGRENIFVLPLQKGKNGIYLQVDATNNKKNHIQLTPVHIEYVLPSPQGQLAALRRSVEYLAHSYSTYPANRIQKEIDLLEAQKGEKDILSKIRALQIKALVKNNPIIDFRAILLRRATSGRFPANWLGNSGIPKNIYNNEISQLSLEDFSLKKIYKPEHKKSFVGDINLHFDGDRMLYSSISTNDDTWQVFEIKTDGTEKRQVTRSAGPDVDNYNGIYLPDGNIIFNSTANMHGVPCIGGNGKVGTLYWADSLGKKVRQLTFEQDADWYPWVMDDGKVMYLRWEYTDNSHYFTRILMTMNPDGTQQRSLYGSNSYWPGTLFYAKNIPGSNNKFVAIVSGHHGVSREGELVMFDVRKGETDARGVVQRIPGYGKKVEGLIRDKYAVGNWPRFLHPYPLSDTYFLAAGCLSPSGKWGIYLLDRFDNIVLLKEEKGRRLYEPIPLKSRKKPMIIPPRFREDAKDAVLYIQDIYEGPGLKGIPRGTVKNLRIFTYSYAYRKMGGHNALSIEGGWDAKRLLGTVPVETDGSTMFRIPHSTPLSIQPLDQEGAALQLMRSWLVAMPGESLSCVGCHESAKTPPLQTMTLAMQKGPQQIQPWRGEKPHGFSFLREVQPILDRRCTGCHNGGNSQLPNFENLDPIPRGREFAESFHDLHPFVRRPGCESDFRLLTPMDFHVSTSELIQLLKKGHYEVSLTSNEWASLVTWIDLNVPYHPTWTAFKGEKKVCDIANRAKELRNQYTNIKDDPEWMPPASESRPEYEPPPATKETAQTPPPILDSWPFDTHVARKMQGDNALKTIPLKEGITLRLRRIPEGAFIMGSSDGAKDERPLHSVRIEKPFWMSEREITNEQFKKFDPTHNSRVIDQQWKDHVYPGYPADEPQMPVIRVSWNEAMGFCKWLSEKTGLHVTLPSESQWEWACRAGNADSFSFGSTGFEQFANLADVNIADLAVIGIDPHPIPDNHHRRNPETDFVPRDNSFDDQRLLPDGTAQYKPNAWGLFDMHGNVAEWTRSSYEMYPGHEMMNGLKVVRGGSWRDRPKRATSSFRLAYQSFQPVFNVGFRVIVEINDREI